MRTRWIDVLRGALLLMVVVYHVRNGAISEGVDRPEWLDDLLRGLLPFRMPVLMMLSGMFLHRALAKGTRRYVTGKLSALVVPYVGWFGLFYFGFLHDTHRPTDRWYVEVVVPQTPLWFLCYLSFYFAMSLPLRTAWLRLAALVGTLVWLEVVGDESQFHLVFHYACFLAGSVIADPPARVRRWLGPLVGPRGLAVLTALAVVPMAWAWTTAVDGGTERTAPWVLVAVAGLLLGRAVARLVQDTPPGRWLAALGPMTMVAFLAHTALLAAVPSPASTWWASLLVTLAVTLGAVAVVRRWEVAWLPFDVRRGWRAVRDSRSGSAQARADVEPDLGVDDDLLRGRDAVDEQLGVDRGVALDQR
jgi:fucose 4-O-acetylase-like acetyltransferase